MWNRLLSLWDRGRPSLVTALASLGGGYLVLNYVHSKLDEVQGSLAHSGACTQTLRRRFEQYQEDCSFTVSALVPTLATQILDRMNVDKLVQVLSQTRLQTRPATPLGGPGLSQDARDRPPNGRPQQSPVNLNRCTSDLVGSASSQLDMAESRRPEPSGAAQAASASLGSPSNPLPVSQPSEPLARPDGTPIRKRSEIWKEMMILSFARLFTCLYGLTLLTIQTHIQLGLLGREAYVRSIVPPDIAFELDDDIGSQGMLRFRDGSKLSLVTERRYLTFSWWYLHEGWKVMAGRIRGAVEEVLAPWSLRDTVTLANLEQIFQEVQNRVQLEADGTHYSFSRTLLPSTSSEEVQTLLLGGMNSEECEVDCRLRSLLEETQDLLDCPDFQAVLTSAMARVLDVSLSSLARNASSAGLLPSQSRSTLAGPVDARFLELHHGELLDSAGHSAKLVELLPIITKESCHIVNTIPNEYTETVCDTPELKEFSTVIYTTFAGLADEYDHPSPC